MLSTFLDAATLFALWDAPGPAVRATIEAGGWGGMLWPGHEDWEADTASLTPDDLRTGSQLLSLGIHYFTSRHPDAGALEVCTAAQVLCRYACEFLEGYPVEEHEIYEQADAWVLSLAGGMPPEPGGIVALTPPYDEAGHPLVPGGDAPAFTRALVPVIEALVFASEPEARRLADQFLAQAGDPHAQRASEIFHQVVLGEVIDLEAAVVCADCGPPVFHTCPSRGLHPRAPLRRSPPPS